MCEKIIHVKSCKDCPNIRQGSKWEYCHLNGSENKLLPDYSFPMWCPLDNVYKNKIRHVNDRIVFSRTSSISNDSDVKEILSKCCNSTITIGVFASECDNCGMSVNPDTGEPYGCNTVSFGGIN